MGSRRTCGLVALLLAVAPGCASWEETYEDVVKPLNRALHQDYAQAFRDMDVETFARLHAPDVQGAARSAFGELTRGLEAVDRARAVIREVRPHPERDGALEAEIWLRVDGRAADGSKRSLVQDHRLICARVGGAWKVVGRAASPQRLLPEPGVVFRDASSERGLVFENRSRGAHDRTGQRRIYLPGSGLSAGDVDGDGLDDLLLVGGDSIRLFRNQDGAFQDATRESGIRTPPTGECRAGYFGDVDGDGDVDLFVAMLEHDNLLFLNDGTGRFEERSAVEAGLVSTQHTTSACFADFDNDGDLDLYLVNGNNLTQVEPEPIYNAKNGVANQLFLNRGDGTFVDGTEASGTGDSGWGLACCISDVDRDGDVDLLVANDFGRDMLYLNRGDATFEDVSDESGLTYRNSSMSANFGDLNGDGLPDPFVSGMASNARWVTRMPGFPARGPFPLNVLIRDTILGIMWEMLHGNRFYLSRGDGTYGEHGKERGIFDQEWGWGSVFFDVDHDGDLDLYGVNGFWTGEETEDT